MKTVVFIVGPTSSGKTQVALGLAERAGGEIISCDSMQVYTDMDVITRPPDDEALSRAPHYLVKKIPPEEEYSAARFVEESNILIADILSRGKLPIIAGGTGLYMGSLLDGLFSSPPKHEEMRKEMEKQAVERGSEYLHEKLEKIDPATASKLHSNDMRRIIRALEVYELTGKAISEKKKESAGIASKYDCRIFGLELPRELLYGRINDTVENMFKGGLVEEVKELRERRLGNTAGKALGIKEASLYLDGKTGFREAVEELKKNTRRYAKRQLTWFRADKRVRWIDANRDLYAVVNDIQGKLG